MIEEEIIINKEDTPPDPEPDSELLPAIIRSELNFLQFPFFALSWRGLKSRTRTEYRFVEERDGKRVDLLWLVLANAEYGHPNPFDYKVARAIEVVIDEAYVQNGNQLPNPIQFSIYRLARLIGLKSDSSIRVYKRIRESIERIKATVVKSTGSFFLADAEIWIDDVFSIYDRVTFKGARMADGKIAETNYVWLNEFYLRNINARHVMPLDYQFLSRLKNPLSRRICEVLTPKFYGLPDNQPYYHLDYLNYCQTLPVTPQKYYSDVQKQFKTVHEELGREKYLTKVAYVLHEDSKAVKTIRFYLGDRAKRERNGEFLRQANIPDIEEQLLLPIPGGIGPSELSEYAQRLYERGLSKQAAATLTDSYPDDLIREKLEIFDFLTDSGSDLVSENPAGWLRKAIEENFELSDEQRKRAETHTRDQVEANRQRRWLDEGRPARIEQILRDWDRTPPETWVEGIFGVWCQVNRKDPDSEEAQAKLQEYIDGLPKTEEERREYIRTKVVPAEPPQDFTA